MTSRFWKRKWDSCLVIALNFTIIPPSNRLSESLGWKFRINFFERFWETDETDFMGDRTLTFVESMDNWKIWDSFATVEKPYIIIFFTPKTRKVGNRYWQLPGQFLPESVIQNNIMILCHLHLKSFLHQLLIDWWYTLGPRVTRVVVGLQQWTDLLSQ